MYKNLQVNKYKHDNYFIYMCSKLYGRTTTSSTCAQSYMAEQQLLVNNENCHSKTCMDMNNMIPFQIRLNYTPVSYNKPQLQPEYFYTVNINIMIHYPTTSFYQPQTCVSAICGGRIRPLLSP